MQIEMTNCYEPSFQIDFSHVHYCHIISCYLGDNCIVFENFMASIGEHYSIIQSQTRNIKQLH
jgi:hypothetical protein